MKIYLAKKLLPTFIHTYIVIRRNAYRQTNVQNSNLHIGRETKAYFLYYSFTRFLRKSLPDLGYINAISKMKRIKQNNHHNVANVHKMIFGAKFKFTFLYRN